jgi:hypothetical protein
VKRGVELGPYPGYAGDLKVTGEVNAYLSETGNAYLTYTLAGLEDECKTTPEGVGNACGIHIHEGKTCDDADAVGGHYYATDSDPWGVLGYNTKWGGRARGSVKATIGKGEDIAGRAIVVHDSTGGRVACALAPSKLEVQRTASSVTLATFDGAEETSLEWRPVNDPVMGGQSTSTFSNEPPIGVFQGEVKVVAFLGEPGFCNLETTGSIAFPDVTGTDGITVTAKQTLDGGLSNFDVRFATTQSDAARRGAAWEADFTMVEGQDSYFVPYSAFTCQWRGNKLDTCGNIAEQLSSVTQLVVGSGGVAGKFRLELTSLAATTKPGVVVV